MPKRTKKNKRKSNDDMKIIKTKEGTWKVITKDKIYEISVLF